MSDDELQEAIELIKELRGMLASVTKAYQQLVPDDLLGVAALDAKTERYLTKWTHSAGRKDAVSREEILRLLRQIQLEAYVDDDSEDRQAKLSRIYTMAGDAVARLASPLPH